MTDNNGAPATTTSQVTVVDAANAALFRASSTANGSGTAASVVVPAAVQPGDVLVYIVTANLATTATTPAGWSLIGTQSDGTPDMRSWVFTRSAVAGTAGSTVTATLGATGKSSRILMAYSNAEAPTVLASSVMGTSSTSLAAPAVAVSPSGSAVINYWSDKGANNNGWTLPNTVSARAASVGTSTGHITAAAGDAVVTAANWPSRTATTTAAGTKGIAWSIVVKAAGVAPTNAPPAASFTSSCTGLSCTFDAAGSTDSDGTIAGYAWDFGDALSGTTVNPSHTYGGDGTFDVTLTVTDDDGATNSITAPVNVAAATANVGFRASATANGTATNATIVVPATVIAGDQLLLFVTSNLATTLSTPTDWTLLGTQTDGTPDVQSWVFTRTAVAGTASSTVTATLGASAKVSRVLVAYSGAEPITTVAASVMGASSTALTSPSVTVAENGSLVVGHWADKSAGNAGWTLPASVTARASSLGSGGGQITAAAGDAVANAGTYPGATANSAIAGTKGIAWSVVVAPA